jgi:hypothetical protein
MNPFHAHTLMRLGFLACATALSGCAGMDSNNASQARKIRITSDPAGAIAYADGSEIGATPLDIVPGAHFRSGFAGLSYRYVGKLSIKKAGCETWSTEVNDNILSKDVHAKLKCDPNDQPASTSAPVAGTPSNPVSKPPQGDQYIERLERIESLRKKGLISDEEYRQLRDRIIEKL